MMRMWSTATRAFVVVYVVVAFSGCASNGYVVRCDGRLEPINMPMPRAVQPAPGDSIQSDASRSDHE